MSCATGSGSMLLERAVEVFPEEEKLAELPGPSAVS